VNILIRQAHGSEKRPLRGALITFRHDTAAGPIHRNLPTVEQNIDYIRPNSVANGRRLPIANFLLPMAY
jgi:hypothetical protein